jgi:hypothetical protein
VNFLWSKYSVFSLINNEKNLDLENIEIVDNGEWMFGHINAFKARVGERLITPAQKSSKRYLGEKNWQLYIVLRVKENILHYDIGGKVFEFGVGGSTDLY